METTGARRVALRYDQLGTRYDRWTRWMDGNLVDRFRRELLSSAHGRVLEIAVGSGKNLGFYPDDCSLVGVDLSEKMLEVAAGRAARLGRRLTTRRLDATDLPFENGSFDTVVCTLAGCTFSNPRDVFEEMLRVCAPGGSGLFLEHVRPSSPILRAVFERMTPLLTQVLSCHPNRDTMSTIMEAGWNVERQERGMRGVLVAAWTSPA